MTAADYEFLFQLSVDERTAPHWRYRGAPPRPEAFIGELWDGVLTQFIVERKDQRERLGLVTAYDARARDGHCHIAAIFRPDTRIWPLEAVFLFVNYLFAEFGFRKLYGEVIEYNLDTFASAIERWLEPEGVLRGHELHAGHYWDVHVLALWRERFERDRERLLARITRELPDVSDLSVASDVYAFDVFAELLLAELELDPSPVHDDTRLVADLAFDSVLTFEMLLVVEEWIGVMLPEALIGQLHTMGDVYAVYRARVFGR